MTGWLRVDEPLHVTLLRSIGIAVAVGALVTLVWGGGLQRWAIVTALALWPSLGGHWLELWFLNWLRPRLSTARPVQIAARLVVWFIGGIAIALGVWLTATVLTRPRRTPWAMWWIAGFAFIGIELVVHLGLERRGRPSFFNGLG